MKLNYIRSFFCISLLSTSILFFNPSHASEFDLFNEDLFPNISINEMNNFCRIDKNGVVSLLRDLGAIAILEEFFYKHTNKINIRSLLDYPFNLFKEGNRHNHFGFELFYNFMHRCYFTSNSSRIGSYLALEDPDFLAQIEAIFDEIKENDLSAVDPSFILPILSMFADFTVQQRRLGFMFHGNREYRRWHFEFYFPLYYLECNHFVEDEQKQAIEQALKPFVPPATDAEITAFQDQHFISDKLGFGDLRLMLDRPLIQQHFWKMRFGLFATIPTACALTKGLKGSTFHLVTQRPTLDLIDLFDTLRVGASLTETQAFNFALGALDELAAMLLEQPLGNGGHVGLGFYLKNKTPLSSFLTKDWAHRVIFKSFLSLEYQFPNTHLRAFVTQDDSAEFAAHDFDSTDDQEINDNYNFLVQKIVERFYPFAVPTKIQPGVIFRSDTQIFIDLLGGVFTLGSDTWVQGKEKLSHVVTPPSATTPLSVRKAQGPFAYQWKYYISAAWKKEHRDKLVKVGLYGDTTWANSGIGQDFTITFSFDVVF